MVKRHIQYGSMGRKILGAEAAITAAVKMSVTEPVVPASGRKDCVAGVFLERKRTPYPLVPRHAAAVCAAFGPKKDQSRFLCMKHLPKAPPLQPPKLQHAHFFKPLPTYAVDPKSRVSRSARSPQDLASCFFVVSPSCIWGFAM